MSDDNIIVTLQTRVDQHSVEVLHVATPRPSVEEWTTRQSAPVLPARRENPDQGASAAGVQEVQE